MTFSTFHFHFSIYFSFFQHIFDLNPQKNEKLNSGISAKCLILHQFLGVSPRVQWSFRFHFFWFSQTSFHFFFIFQILAKRVFFFIFHFLDSRKTRFHFCMFSRRSWPKSETPCWGRQSKRTKSISVWNGFYWMVMFGTIIAVYKKGHKDQPDGKLRETGTQNCLSGFAPRPIGIGVCPPPLKNVFK